MAKRDDLKLEKKCGSGRTSNPSSEPTGASRTERVERMTMSENVDRLKRLLAEIFELDQADLDFGIYRIMNTKREEILRFLDRDLLPQVGEAFQAYQAENRAVVEAELGDAIEKAKELGVDPEVTQKVKELRAKLAQTVDVTALENEVYSHLYNFFRRYYQEGDFISLRRYKEGVYAIPYEGEEVKLHWANHDQYYIKTSEHLRDYTFRLPSGRRAHFKLIEADTDKDNNRASNGNERRFILSQDEPLAEENGELVARFEYRPHLDRTKQAELNAVASDRILNQSTGFDDWRRELASFRPTEKNPGRTLLEKHLTEYTARNTFDYFIHRDLYGFLRRELDFYIKNEVMHLDDVESDTAARVEQYLSKIRAIRRIAHKLIDFLAQIENFQKKLWIKKKFVVETRYCITLDRIFAIEEEQTRDWLIAEVISNDAQREEWVTLCAIDDVDGDLITAGYSNPLKPEFLKEHPTLVLDTRHFPRDFTNCLLASIPDLDEVTNGVLIHSENFQALALLTERYRDQIKAVYIDPPYNTGNDEFVYKDDYQHSSWLAMFAQTFRLARPLMASGSAFFVSCDDNEMNRLREFLDGEFGRPNLESQIIVQSNKRGQTYKSIAKTHEYLLAYDGDENTELNGLPREIDDGDEDQYGRFELWELRNRNPRFGRFNRPNLYFPIHVSPSQYEQLGYSTVSVEETNEYQIPVHPRNSAGEDSCWRWALDKVKKASERGDEVLIGKQTRTGEWRIFQKSRKAVKAPKSIWTDNNIINEKGTVELGSLGLKDFGFPKPLGLIENVVKIGMSEGDMALDYFAGTGTMGHAIINVNREDDGERKFILVEMGTYFDSVLVPRIKKAIFTPEWRDGKPTRMPTQEDVQRSPSIVKILRLESYEDALNNLELKRTDPQQALLEQEPGFREDYVLRYMLDVESRENPSLLNIERFEDPFNYKLNIATGSAGETKPTVIDLVETFNYVIGLRVTSINDVRGVRVVAGMNPQGERVLILWRNTKALDNDALDAWFREQGYNTKDQEYDVIYVNCDNNLETLRRADQTWKVRLIEDECRRLMFEDV